MERSSSPPNPLPPVRSTIATLTGQPEAAEPGASDTPPPARRWSWSLEPDALIDGAGDQWWESLRPLPQQEQPGPEQHTQNQPQPRRAQSPQPQLANEHGTCDSVAPVALPRAEPSCPDLDPESVAPCITESLADLADPHRRSRPWLWPALVAAAALVVVLGGTAAESAADARGQAATLQAGPSAAGSLDSLPSLDSRAERAKLGALTRLSIERGQAANHAPPTQLVVNASQPCAQIWLDARLRGSGQGQTFTVAPGPHAVACRSSSGAMTVRRVVVAEGQTATLFLTP